MSGISTQRLSDLKDSNALVATPEEVRRMADELYARRIGSIKGPPAAPPPPTGWAVVLDAIIEAKREIYIYLRDNTQQTPGGPIRKHDVPGFYVLEGAMTVAGATSRCELIFSAESLVYIETIPDEIATALHADPAMPPSGLTPDDLAALGLDAIVDAEPAVGNGG